LLLLAALATELIVLVLLLVPTQPPAAKKGLHPPLRRLINRLRGVDDSVYEERSHLRVACDM
jgi:hypothetical protein